MPNTNAETTKRQPPKQVKIKDSPYVIETATKIPPSLLEDGRRATWPFRFMKLKQFIEVPPEDKDKALMSAKQCAARRYVDVPDPKKDDGSLMSVNWRFAMMAKTDEKTGEVITHKVKDDETGETKDEPVSYIIMRVR